MDMPQYRSHKTVRALKITHLELSKDEQVLTLHFAGEHPPKDFKLEELTGKPTPQANWYMVKYEDGYISFSPQKSFEEGYTRV